MKGWNGESQKHSMAARGIRTKDNLFKEYKNAKLTEEEIEQKKYNEKILKDDIKTIILSLEHNSGYDMEISHNFKTIYNYFKFEPNYSVSKIKSRYIWSNDYGLSVPIKVHEFIIKSKETGMLIKIKNSTTG